MSRRGKRRKSAPGRIVQTLRGPASYVISGQAPAEWRVIETAMARCDSPGLRVAEHAHDDRSEVEPPRTRKTVDQLKRDFDRDIRKLSGQLAPWITEPNQRTIHRLQTRIDRTIDAWEDLLGEERKLRERQPLP